MSSRAPSSALSSPPASDFGEETSSIVQQSELDNMHDELEGKESTGSKTDNAGTSNTSKLSGYKADAKKDLRLARYQARYETYQDEAKLRRQKRRDIEDRNKIWQEARDKAQARIEAIDKEKEEILRKIETWSAAREEYGRSNTPAVTEEMDAETQRKWDAYFDLETDELDV